MYTATQNHLLRLMLRYRWRKPFGNIYSISCHKCICFYPDTLLPTCQRGNDITTRIMERSWRLAFAKHSAPRHKTLVYQFIVENIILSHFIGWHHRHSARIYRLTEVINKITQNLIANLEILPSILPYYLAKRFWCALVLACYQILPCGECRNWTSVTALKKQ